MQKTNNAPIVLVGMMGCGKTTVGRKIKKLLGVNFYDTDIMIKQKCKLGSTAEIFELHGEEYFRQQETTVLKELSCLVHENFVCATGGGAFFYNTELVLQLGRVFYIKATENTILKRLSSDGAKKGRPLLNPNSNTDYSAESVRKKIVDLMKQREETYSRAHFVVNGNLSIDEIAFEIMALL